MIRQGPKQESIISGKEKQQLTEANSWKSLMFGLADQDCKPAIIKKNIHRLRKKKSKKNQLENINCGLAV